MLSDVEKPITKDTSVKTDFATLAILISACVAGALAVFSLKADTSTNSSAIANHEVRIKDVETKQADIAVMKNDVEWIRKTLERIDKKNP